MKKINDIRKEEILDSFKKLFESICFNDISFKSISKNTSCGRTSIYNYFKTKEDILIELYKDEFKRWEEDLNDILNIDNIGDVSLYSSLIAKSIEKREVMLKIMSLNFASIEENVSFENLVSFKKIYFSVIDTFKKTLYKFFIMDIKKETLDKIASFYLIFLKGLYSFVRLTNKQKEAIKLSENTIEEIDIFTYSYETIYMLISSERGKI